MKKLLLSLIAIAILLSACSSSDQTKTDLECLKYKDYVDNYFGTSSQALNGTSKDSCLFEIEIPKEILRQEAETEAQEFLDNFPMTNEEFFNSVDSQ